MQAKELTAFVAQKIKNTRITRGLSQEAISYDLNMSQVAYCNMENGKTEIKVTKLLQLTIIFQMPLLEFFPNELSPLLLQHAVKDGEEQTKSRQIDQLEAGLNDLRRENLLLQESRNRRGLKIEQLKKEIRQLKERQYQ